MDNRLVGLFIHKSYEDFNKGSFNDVILKNNLKAEISLIKNNEDYTSEGIYTSEVIHTLPFHNLIISWNADTPIGTALKVEAQVLVDKAGAICWSKWFSFGTWSLEGQRSSVSKACNTDEFAFLDTDTLKLHSSQGEFANAVRYRLTLTTTNTKITPTVRLISMSTRKIQHNDELSYLYFSGGIDNIINIDKELKVPRLSQMIRDPKIAGVICSPTSITMILNYYGLNLIPEETAERVYDTEYEGYGNWPFNTAFAGSMGYEAYVAYCHSINELKKEIYNGYPLAVSVKYKNHEEIDAKLPVIHGAPIKKTNGHLIVVCGFKKVADQEFIIVNDPAAESDETVKLEYLLEEFDAAWKSSGRVAYIIHP